MEQTVEKVLLLPRFSSFLGYGPFLTTPLNARIYESAFVTVWCGPGCGVVPSTIQFTVQESQDMVVWSNIGFPLGAPPNEETTTSVPFRFDWIRLRITQLGAAPMTTLWAVGDFVRRRGAEDGRA